jgi:hypothetical protein
MPGPSFVLKKGTAKMSMGSNGTQFNVRLPFESPERVAASAVGKGSIAIELVHQYSDRF